jgi:CelD/BcsL family acetyltransferase involved in cellulose biosynthesis
MGGTVQLSTLTAPDAVARLPADQWDALVGALPHPSPRLLHAWVTARLNARIDGCEPRVHVARRDGRLVGALPFEVARHGRLRIAGLAGGQRAEFGDILLAPQEPESTAARLVELAAHADQDFGHFYGLASDSRLAALAGLTLVERVTAFGFDLSPGWEAVYRTRISRSHRKDYGRKRRGLAALGRLETRMARTPAEVEAALEHCFRLHALRWGSRYDTSDFGAPASRQFVRDVAARLAAQDAFRVLTLELDGAPVAFLSFFVVGGALSAHRTGFDPAYARFSPGALVFFDAFEAAEAQGLMRVELGSGEERFKRQLAGSGEPLYDGVGLATRIRGTVASTAESRALALRHRVKSSRQIRTAYRRARALAH